MKQIALLTIGLGTLALVSSCGKSQESAYRQAYERARAQEQQSNTQAVAVTPAPQQVAPVVTTPVATDDTPVRTIQGGFSVLKGEPLKAYSVVTGSFVNQTNAEGMMNSLRNRGYSARIVKTNETINGQTGWYRVVASSFDNKAQAVQSRNELSSTYPGSWLLHSR